MAEGRPYRLAFVLGQTLGNAVFASNLRSVVGEDPDVAASWYLVDYPRWAGVRTPGSATTTQAAAAPSRPRKRLAKSLVRRALGNRRQYELWATWASTVALRRLAPDLLYRRHDAVFFHTGSSALFAGPAVRGGVVVSLDATPQVPEEARHITGEDQRALVAAASHRLHRRAYGAATFLAPWSRWAGESLVSDYGADPDRIRVTPPGIDLERWRPRRNREPGGRTRLLFVGRDFQRKGGDTLLEAFSRHLGNRYELDIVTRFPQPAPPGIRFHNELPANGDELRSLYERADLFVFPTRWDPFGIVAIEAMAAGLPVVATRLNAIPEIVDDGVSGLLVPPDDPAALAAAIDRVAADPARMAEMGREGRRLALERFDLRANGRQVLDVLKQAAAVSRTPEVVRVDPVL